MLGAGIGNTAQAGRCLEQKEEPLACRYNGFIEKMRYHALTYTNG